MKRRQPADIYGLPTVSRLIYQTYAVTGQQ